MKLFVKYDKDIPHFDIKRDTWYRCCDYSAEITIDHQLKNKETVICYVLDMVEHFPIVKNTHTKPLSYKIIEKVK